MQHDRWSHVNLKNYQAHALHACRKSAYECSPFYQRFHHGLTERPLQELPVLTKAVMMEHFDEIVTDRAIHLQEVKHFLAEMHQPALFLGRYRAMSTSAALASRECSSSAARKERRSPQPLHGSSPGPGSHRQARWLSLLRLFPGICLPTWPLCCRGTPCPKYNSRPTNRWSSSSSSSMSGNQMGWLLTLRLRECWQRNSVRDAYRSLLISSFVLRKP